MKDNLSYQQYEPPEIVVCRAEVELGFAGSDTGDGGAITDDWHIIRG